MPVFVVGQEYNRREDIHLKYGGSWQNGVSSSAVCPAIFLFTGDSGEQFGYRDHFDESGVFSYSGEGQIGDMVFKGGNRSIREHAKEGRALYLFRSLGKGKKQQYLGEFVLANHSIRRGPDRDGTERDIIVFHLLRVDAAQDAPGVSDKEQAPSTLADARRLALAACGVSTGPAGQAAVQTVYARSRVVRDYVLMRANGSCESCGADAPFRAVDGRPYLEAHHTTRLSDGGIDHPKYVAALCPTCHRHIHYGEDGSHRNGLLMGLLASKEPGT